MAQHSTRRLFLQHTAAMGMDTVTSRNVTLVLQTPPSAMSVVVRLQRLAAHR